MPKSGDEWYDLSGGWKKRCMQRKAGSSQGSWDVYLYPPGDIKRLRSSTELMRFVKDHPEMSIDPLEVNMDLPFKVSPDGKIRSFLILTTNSFVANCVYECYLGN